MILRAGHYYRLVHKDSGHDNPVLLVVKVLNVIDSYLNSEMRIEIVNVTGNPRFPKGRKTMFYCNWCSDIKELNDDELLAYVL